MVLGGALLVTLMGMSALFATRTQFRGTHNTLNAAQARLHARSAIERGLLEMIRDPDWRTNRTCGIWFSKVAVGDGSFTLIATESDDDLNTTDICAAPATSGDAFSAALSGDVVFTACGYQGDSRQILQVDLRPDAADSDAFRDALTAIGPLAWWRLGDDAGASQAADKMQLQAGTYQNGTTPGIGVNFRYDTAARFDGVDDHVAIPHHDAFLLNEGSVQLWFRADRVSGTQGIFGKAAWGYGTGGHFAIWLEGTKLKAGLESATATYTFGDVDVAVNQWYHVVVTFGSNGMKMYLNGLDRASHTYTGGLGTSSGGTGNYEPIALGVSTGSCYPSGTLNNWGNPYKGLIDEVAIIDRALSLEEVQALYALGSPNAPTSMDISSGTWRSAVDN